DVADARDTALIHEERFRIAAARSEQLSKGCEGELGVKRIGTQLLRRHELVGVLGKSDMPEHSRIDVGQVAAVRETKTQPRVGRGGASCGTVNERAGHSEMERDPAALVERNQQMLAMPTGRSHSRIKHALSEARGRQPAQYSPIGNVDFFDDLAS